LANLSLFGVALVLQICVGQALWVLVFFKTKLFDQAFQEVSSYIRLP
jgi:hypothetical protein